MTLHHIIFAVFGYASWSLTAGQPIPCSERKTARAIPSYEIGNPRAFHLDVNPSPLKGSAIIDVSDAGPKQELCCPRGYIKDWNVAFGAFMFVGKIGARCEEGTAIPAVVYGFNATEFHASPGACPSWLVQETRIPTRRDNLFIIRSGDVIRQFMLRNVFAELEERVFGCDKGEEVVGFGLRSSCLSVVDLKIFCAKIDADEASNSSGGLADQASRSRVQKVFLVLGTVVPFVLVAALATNKIRQMCTKRDTAYLPLAGGLDLPHWSTPHTQHAAGVTAVPFSQGLAEMEFTHMDSFSMSVDKSIRSDSLPEVCQNWKIEPSHLCFLYHQDKPIVLGEGGFGTVLLALYCGSKAAVKVVRGGSPESQAQFLNEIRTLEQSKFSHIVQFYGVSVYRDKLCLVMEFMDSKNLYERIRLQDRSMQWYQRGRNVMVDIAIGVNFLHRYGIAHLDLKSPNVLLSSNGQAKIADVALGKLVNDAHAEYTAPRIESPAWCAPERRHGKCGLPSDIYALGTIMWEVCTMRKPPREGPLMEIKVPQEAPQDVADMITHCRSEDPSERPTIGGLCDWLKTKLQTS